MTKITLRLFFPSAALLILFFTPSVLSQQNEDKKLRAQQFVSSKELIKNDLEPLDRFYLLTRLAPAALAVGDIKQAEKYSIDLQSAWQEVKVKIPFDFPEPRLAKHISNTIFRPYCTRRRK